jgi:hypothetical protein
LARSTSGRVAEVVGERLGGFSHLFGVVRLARADGDQRLEFVFLAQVVAFELHAGDHVALALRHVDGDRDVLPIGRDRDLGGVDAEFEVAPVEVVGTQRLEVGVELCARVAVRLRIPGQEATRIEVEQALERGFAEGLVADNVDFLDLRGLALGDGEGQVHAVALDRRDGGDHLRTVQALVDVLALQLLLGAVRQGLVVRSALGQADLAQRFLQRVLVEFLGAREVDVCDRGTLFHDHHQHVAIHFEPDILEQAEREQRADRGRTFFIVVLVADAKGQRREHGAGLDPLQAFDPDVAHGERVHGPGIRHERHRDDCRNGTHAKALQMFFHESRSGPHRLGAQAKRS